MSKRTATLWLLAGLALVVALPVTGSWVRRHREKGCVLDGMRIEPAYRVRIIDHAGKNQELCCIQCAEIWLKGKDVPLTSIFVTDEASGAEIPAGSAQFVRSLVVTTPVTRNRVHAFKNRDDAEAHAKNCLGTLLSEAEQPFANRQAGRYR